MRRILGPALALTAAACASTPPPKPPPVVGPMAPHGGALIGLDVHELGRRFGQPRFQVQEGVGTKLQWAANGCVLDAYLYPPPSGAGLARVTHADARRPSGADLSVESCLALMER